MRARTKLFGLAPVFLTTALFAGLFTLSSRPARADGECTHGRVQNGFAFFTNDEGNTSLGQEQTLDPEPTDTSSEIHVIVERHDGTFHDVSEGPNLVTVVPQGKGTVSDHQYTAVLADEGKTLQVISIFTDPCDNTTHYFTTYIKVSSDVGENES